MMERNKLLNEQTIVLRSCPLAVTRNKTCEEMLAKENRMKNMTLRARFRCQGDYGKKLPWCAVTPKVNKRDV